MKTKRTVIDLALMSVFVWSSFAWAVVPIELVHPPASLLMEELKVNGDLRVSSPDKNTLRERAEFNLRFTLGPLSDGVNPAEEVLVVDLDAGLVPCFLLFIPAGAFVETDKGFRLIDSDPQVSGVRLILAEQGEMIEDLTGKVKTFDARLKTDDHTSWRLNIEVTTLVEDRAYGLWLPAMQSMGTELTLGNDLGAAAVRSAEFLHK